MKKVDFTTTIVILLLVSLLIAASVISAPGRGSSYKVTEITVVGDIRDRYILECDDAADTEYVVTMGYDKVYTEIKDRKTYEKYQYGDKVKLTLVNVFNNGVLEKQYLKVD